ncbi:MAG: LEPR-XLL domain-containing protein, partial [Kiritimatiellae bacterium]|nr:LEPR-XLL domain-containing protein [Kiritimatiellia bacterium]
MKHLHAHINPFELEALEPRIMLSGDAAEAMVGGSGSLAQEVIQGSGDVQQEDTLIPISGEQEDGADSGQQPDLFGTVIDYQEPMGDEGGTTVLMIDGGSIQDGETLIATEVNIGDSVWSGDNRVIADRLTISGTMTATPGARLTLMPTGKDASIWLGGKDDGFSLSANELELLSTAGFEEVVIGHEDGGHDMTLTSLSYKGNLTLRTPADGGAFYTEGPISHSEGELNFIGSGHTAFTNDDTITEGTALNVDDTVQLVYTVDNENEFLLDTTGGGTHAQGNDIVISGDIRGTSEGLGGTLYLNAGTQGNIFIGNSEDPDPETTGNIGTSAKLERIIILNAADVTILGNIRVDVFIQQDGTGDTVLGSGLSNFVRIESGLLDITTDGNVTVSGDLEVLEGDVDISITGASTAAQFQVAGASDVDGDFTIHRAGKVLMKGNVTVSGHMSQGIGLSDSRFESDVSVGSMSLRADTRIHFLNDLTLTQGDLTLVTNNIDFNGGVSSVTGALDTNDLSISNAYFRPIAANLNMNIGAPLGATTMFPFTTTDIAALSDGFVSITFGYDSGSTNTARIGTAAFKDPVTVYAGTILVNGNHSARKALTLEAATGDITITNGALVRVQNEQINNVWGSSDLTLTADVGDVLFNNGAYLQIENDDDADLSQGSAITIVSTLGQVRDQSATANFQTARDLDVTAAGDIYLFTDIENLWAESTVAGDIELFELDGLHIYEAITANGAIRVDTGGLTRVDLASSLTDASLNTITVSALGDIEAGKILAGTLGNVTLTSEGQIRRVDGLAAIDHLVQANELELNSEDGVGLASIPLLIETNGLAVANTLTGLIRIEQVAGRDTMG